MNTRIDFTKLNKGIPIIHKPIKNIPWNSSFMDLYNYADVINIHNIGKNRLIILTFEAQNLFPDWINVTQNIIVLIKDVELNLKTQGIVSVSLGTFPIGEKEYYNITKKYFDDLLKNREDIYETMIGETSCYSINNDLFINLAYSDYNYKGQVSEFYFKIINAKG
ncbi:MAG: hypothetical protein LBN93_07115 [Candidatus Symbiothrix sp.]|jgi:hypothetical protein|nr:hypothetical protein [Candidatus Symbiothrix sp.]